jgi:hypothetical protein
VDQYTVTIAPDNLEGTQTVVRLEVDAGTPRITEVSVKSCNATRVSAPQMPAIDLELLLRAVLPAIGSTAGSPDNPQSADRGSGGLVATTTPRQRRPIPETSRPGSAPKRAGSPRMVKSGTAATGPSKSSKQRVYRTMPADFTDAYGRDTMSRLAERFGVPQHTVQAWIKTARKQGTIPPARRRRSA